MRIYTCRATRVAAAARIRVRATMLSFGKIKPPLVTHDQFSIDTVDRWATAYLFNLAKAGALRPYP
jgi:hypothetical protein